ncbi:MAG: NTF2 enzyme family protein [Hyphomonas sp.]|uniref:nuclear transport factor 2 family protein n=1 Tax=Hyphomonas sp. TaxID=87 RepID=UPI0018476B08|nr:nuclear transport factor 2 family protein [Hyphomonas sp.]MBA3069642.1 NTF2 enzyme family protein [Hyphomonas sp.]MBU3921558.1 nuclear transport factor 2 family protein [Alphaproteobacteria bacterium]MBU4062483.1 nuclear transport factor 2 family protein [Alphaproteobacteria bacterium]MBU4163834.1 nuclear transport factor 2 family protein [Alphaproteobacteria bacterium]
MSASAELVQKQLDAYNNQNVDAFLACYADDAVLAGLNGEITHRGLAAIRKRHEDLFYEFPRNHAKLANRIDLGTTVIDHEQVERAPGGDRFEVAAIYTIRDGLITRVDFARGAS